MKMELKNSSVLITGGAGFIGSHLVEEILRKGAEPIVVDNGSRGHKENIEQYDEIDYIEADLTDKGIAEEAAKKADVCFHLAATVGDVSFMGSNPHKIYKNNIIDYNVIESCRIQDVSKIIYVSSACVYPIGLQDEDYALLTEEDVFSNGANPDGDYGWTKTVGEKMCISYNENFDMDVSIVRPFNPYGPRESFDPDDSHVIPAFVRRAAEKKDPFVVWGSGEQVRTFTFVEDVARGMVTAMEELDEGEVVNLTSDFSVTISELAKTVTAVADYDPEIKYDRTKPEGVKVRKPDDTKVSNSLSWDPQVDVKRGVERTYQWYNDNFNTDND